MIGRVEIYWPDSRGGVHLSIRQFLWTVIQYESVVKLVYIIYFLTEDNNMFYEENQIFRYDSLLPVHSPLDPIEDLICWISGLNSISYVSDILRIKHTMRNRTDIKNAAKQISVHAKTVIGFVEQAYSGTPEVSFLPLYYAILNLSKIYLICAGKQQDLLSNRHHGVIYPHDMNTGNELMSEIIKIYDRGVFPFFYKLLKNINTHRLEKHITCSYFYPFIRCVSYEYRQAYNQPYSFQDITLQIKKDNEGKYKLKAIFYQDENPPIRSIKLLKGFTKVGESGKKLLYEGKKISANDDKDAYEKLLNDVRRFLIYDITFNPDTSPRAVVTPISSNKLLLPEEIPIWLAFYHLSNIVRYKPDHLLKFMDSKSWPVLLSLRKHAFLRFLICFWSFLQKQSTILRP